MSPPRGRSPDVAVFIPSLVGGGAERVMVTLGNAFAALGLEVQIVVGKAEGPYVGLIDQERVRLISLGSPRLRSWPFRLAGYLREAKPKALLSALSHANIAAILAKRLARVPTTCVVSEHSTISLVARSSRRRLARLLPMAMRATYRFADRIVAVSGGAAADLAETIGLPLDRIDVVYNPVQLDGVREGMDGPVNHTWFAPGAPPVIVTAGRLIPVKNHSSLITAFSRVRRERECRLVIIGDGPLRADLEEQASRLGVSQDVLMPGFQANPFNWMRGARVFALTSRHEGFGNVLVEAMACGTPVVSTACPGGPSEILEGGKWGRLVPVDDPSALADAIGATLDETKHPDVAKRAADFGVDRAVEGYARVLGLEL